MLSIRLSRAVRQIERRRLFVLSSPATHLPSCNVVSDRSVRRLSLDWYLRDSEKKRNMASSGEKKKIALIGSGNWGSAIAKIVGKNVMEFDRYDKEVLMWVYEEMIDGKKLTEIINEKHENVKYLPGTVLPNNIHA
eukprot:Em0876g3a